MGGILEGVGGILYRVKISALKTLTNFIRELHKRRKIEIIFFFHTL